MIEISQEKKQSKLDAAINQFLRELGEGNVSSQNGFKDLLNNKYSIIRAIRKGVPFYLFDQIKNVSPFDENDWADYLNISTKTLQRHQKEKNYVFKPIHSEKIFELAEVTNRGIEVFGLPDKFHNWLFTSSHALGKMKPVELVKDSYGKELVMSELNRIEYGVFV
ncbi:MAG: antitoxin Xre/MbcA/ParS toxin-binding domain-containing protein [Cyclobacteriaceae bacterium]